jgi:hypothetical protein
MAAMAESSTLATFAHAHSGFAFAPRRVTSA